MVFSLIAGVALLRSAVHKPDVYRQQTVAMIVGIVIPWLGSMLYITGLNPLPGLDLVAISFPFSILCLAIGIFQLGLLELVPIARDLLVENMSDGILVLDPRNRLVDINRSARELLKLSDKEAVGIPVGEVYAKIPDLIESHKGAEEFQEELIFGEKPVQVLKFRISPLYRGNQTLIGRLVVMEDVTSRKLNEQRLEFVSAHDMLTGTHNRNYFEAMLKELKHSDLFPITILVCDINNLKQVNDQFGHKAGDEVIRQTAGLLRNTIREGDKIARLGGMNSSLFTKNR